MKFDYFTDAIKIFLDYISRQFKKNPSYKPHSLIRAFLNAMQGIENAEEGENIAGVSYEGTEHDIYEPYIVVLQKKKDGVEVEEIINEKVQEQIPIDVMIMIFRLQIQLDKIDGETVNPQQAVDALNSVILGNKFFALGDRWKEAREKFMRLLEGGKITLPPNDPRLEEFKQLNCNTPWENYSQRLRALIGTSGFASLNKTGTIIITSPKNMRVEKYKIFDAAIEFMLGKVGRYLGPFKINSY